MSPAISNKSANHGDPVTYAIMAATFLSKVTTTDCVFSKVDLDRFQTTITEHLKLPATRECLNGDIKRLTDMVMSIETCFADIYHQMTRIDNKKLVLDHNGQSVEFAPKWKILHDEYTSLMIESQLTANKVSTKIDDLIQVILPIIESDQLALDFKQSSLDDYIKSLDMFQAQGQKNAARFSRLKRNVDGFRKNVKEIISDQQVAVGRKIKTLEKNIAELQADLESSSSFFSACWEVLKLATPGMIESAGGAAAALHATSTLAATSGLATFSPVIGIAILVIGFISFGFSITKGMRERVDQRQAKTKKLAVLQDEHEIAVFKGHQLKEVLNQMRILDTDFDQMISRLNSIQGIWNMLVTDAQQLSRLLSSLRTAEDGPDFEITASGVKVTYEMLKLALDQYCLAVAK